MHKVPDDKREKSCGAIIWRKSPIYDKIEYLVLKHIGGHHAFAKGHVEDYDSDEEATALREIKEETALDVKIDTGFRESIEYRPAGRVIKTVVYFIASPVNSKAKVKLQKSEIVMHQWLTLAMAVDQVSYASDKKILLAAAEYLNDPAIEEQEVKDLIKELEV